jgi:uncharacterized membrane protein YedE/YeeE
VRFLFAGGVFGFILVKSEAISWFRIQEMFRLESIHMYGLLATAILTAMVGTWLLRTMAAKALDGTPVGLVPKTFGRGTRYWAGGLLFGIGWAITGACPGPLFALVGSGSAVYGVAIVAAMAGTWSYGQLRPRLPH